ncbi:MAG: hypothetical protein IK079_05425 [Desulfovibrio sp.]|nr:hypothetical protein [Desulfovibrio sp.]
MSNDDFSQILINLNTALLSVDQTLYTVASITGFVLIGASLLSLANPHGTKTRHLLTLILGCLLFSCKTFVNVLSLTLFEQEARLAQDSSASLLAPYVHFAVTVFFLLGIVSIIKGLLRLRQLNSGEENAIWSGLTHLFAGVLCVNIQTFAHVFGRTAGGIVQNIIEKLFVE